MKTSIQFAGTSAYLVPGKEPAEKLQEDLTRRARSLDKGPEPKVLSGVFDLGGRGPGVLKPSQGVFYRVAIQAPEAHLDVLDALAEESGIPVLAARTEEDLFERKGFGYPRLQEWLEKDLPAPDIATT